MAAPCLRAPRVNIHGDERRLGIFNIFGDATPGQVNIVRLYPDQLCGWHRHLRQTDYYFCVAGVVKVGLAADLGPSQFVVLDARNPEVLEVPKGTWHGYIAIGGEATLLQYLDHKYDPTDEERRHHLSITSD